MKSVFLLALLFLTPTHAYKFLCNGVTAEGVLESDPCSKSCVEAPTRWLSPIVTYNVDTSVLPEGFSAFDWVAVVDSCFDAWSNTPGSNLKVSNSGKGGRSFGTDSNNHDVFWITSESEWIDQVGAGPEGILGVTLPPYMCSTKTVPYREIDDADIIINAVPRAGFMWHPESPTMSKNYQSARATVAHESGHFLGLGHSCVSCQELMSAQAEFLVEYPQFDDQQGIVALYPDASKAGGFGTICSDSGCQSGLTCHTQNTTKYCSHSCTQKSDCQNNMICTNGFCEFMAATALGAVGLHGDCTASPCDRDLICVGVSDTAAYCYEDCTMSQACSSAKTCHQLKNSQGAPISSYSCMLMVKQGESCGGTTVCQSGLTCASGICVGNGFLAQSCSSGKAPSEIWLLLLLMGILVHRPKKKC